MDKVIVHPGMIKTGSTWLQREFFSRLKGYQILREFDLDDYLEEKNLIISNEVLSGSIKWFSDKPTDKFRYQIADRIRKMFDDPYIILGVRDEEKWLNSVYKQYVKETGSLNKEEFFDAVYDDWKSHSKYVDYLKDNFDKVFIYDFNYFKNDVDGLVKDLCEFLDEPLVKDYNKFKINRTLTKNQIEMLRLMNKYLPFNRKICDLVKFVSKSYGR